MRILGLLLSFLPAIIIMGVFTWEVACSGSSMPPQYVPSTLKYHVTYYVLPSAIGYTAGFIVNGASGNFGYSAGDIINIYGANATKIVDVTIPFVYEDTRDFDEICTTIPESYGFLYNWKFIFLNRLLQETL